MTETVYILTGGNLGSKLPDEFQPGKKDVVICVDGGVAFAKKWSIQPNKVIGDLDSLKKEDLEWLEKKKVAVKPYPVMKDKSDLELGMEHAFTLNPKQILLFGAIGGRLDHLFTNVFLLIKALKRSINCKIIDDEYEIFLVADKVEIQNSKGNIVSLIPLTAVCKEVFLDGFLYPLKGEEIYWGESRGLSNIISSNTASISLEGGLLLIIINKKKAEKK